MNNIKNTIGWADYSWNPITGCSPVSEGCEHCYAAAISKRFGLPWGDPVFHPERLDEPLKLKKPARIFVCSMSDMFHDAVLAVWIDQILEVMSACPQHTFIVLTKRPQNIERKLYEVTADYPIRELGSGDYLPNLWLGVTAENQRRADERIPELLSIPAAKHFVSVEPMLGAVDLRNRLCSHSCEDWGLCRGKRREQCCIENIDWVIAGPETGVGKRPYFSQWIDYLSRQCDESNTPFYDKRVHFIRREWPKGTNL